MKSQLKTKRPGFWKHPSYYIPLLIFFVFIFIPIQSTLFNNLLMMMLFVSVMWQIKDIEKRVIELNHFYFKINENIVTAYVYRNKWIPRFNLYNWEKHTFPISSILFIGKVHAFYPRLYVRYKNDQGNVMGISIPGQTINNYSDTVRTLKTLTKDNDFQIF